MKPTYQRRSLADGSTGYFKNGAAITEAEFYRNVPMARAREIRVLQRGYCESNFRISKKRNAETQALLARIIREA